ncbi:MAG: transposase [Pyrinomonadaceae bacterium]|nr:transposase [Pyrinomonadaceae bacterium]
MQKQEALALRRSRHLPWHSPPHLDLKGSRQYLISATCYEHLPIIGSNPERMTECEFEVLQICRELCSEIYAWCILPNHYHALVKTEHIEALRSELGHFHGRSSFKWNAEDSQRGRKVWHNCFERPMKSERHFWASLNYVHHNPVHHGFVKHCQDWPSSSATQFLNQVGCDRAKEIWNSYPVLDYGKKWDK